MTPDSIHGLSIPRELVLSVLRGEERALRGEDRLADVRRLRVLAALAQQEPQKDAA